MDAWSGIKDNYDREIDKYSKVINNSIEVKPEQFVYNLTINKLSETIKQKEELAMEHKVLTEEVKHDFRICYDLFITLLEWCDEENTSTMIKKCLFK